MRFRANKDVRHHLDRECRSDAERRNDGLGLDGFAGQALYIGPTLYATFGERYFVSEAWNVQVWGGSGALDLVNFERHQVELRGGVRF